MTFSEKMKQVLDQGIAASKTVVAKAASQAQTWGEMGVLKVEVVQLRFQAEKLTAKLGTEVYAAFAERQEPSIAADSPKVRDLVGRIADIGRVIEEKESTFRKLGGKDSELQE